MNAPTTPAPAGGNWRTVPLVLAAGCLIAMVGFGIRSSFGLFLDPMSQAQGWGRETFAMGMAIQNLRWGVGLPVAGARGILLGIALGSLTAGLRILMGADRPYSG